LLPLLLLPLAGCGISSVSPVETLSGVVDAADVIALKETIGTGKLFGVGITAINGTAAGVIQALADLDTDPSNFNSTLTGVVTASDIAAIEAANGTGAINGAGITAINGTAADVVQALADLDTDPSNFNSTLTGVVTASDIAAIEAANGTGTINGAGITAINGTAAGVVQALADLDTDPSNFNSTLTGVADALDIVAIQTANGTGLVVATAVTTITGSAAEIIAILNDGTTSIASNVNFIVDEDASAANIQTIAVATTGSLTATLASGEVSIDLSSATTSAMSLTINGDGGVTFLSTSDFGGAAITVIGTDKASFQDGVNLAGTTFEVVADALLELTVSQIDVVSQSGTIAGDVRVIIADDTVDNSIDALIKVDLEGGTLTFDLLDDADTLVLKAGSSIDLAGGELIIDDGTVDILTNAADFINVGSVTVNSGLTLSVTQLAGLTGQVSTQGEGRLDVQVTSVADVAALEQIFKTLVTAGSVPQISVGVSSSVTDVELLDDIDAELDTDFATTITTATGSNIPVTNSQNVAINVGPKLSLDVDSDTGAIDGRGNDATPTIKVALPSDGSGSLVLNGDQIVIFVEGTEVYSETLTGGELTTTVTLEAVEGSNLITAKIVRGDVSIVSNELRYELDTTPPSAPTVVGRNTISDGVMSAADAAGVFIRVNLPADASKGGSLTLKLGTVDFASSSIGASQLSDGYVNFFITQTTRGSDGTKTFTAVLTDAVGNVGTQSQSFVLKLDTTAIAPTINSVAENNVINIGEETSIISGTTEAGSSVSVAFGSVTKAATVVGKSWSYQLTADDITAMGQGDETISVRQTDAAGNVSAIATQDIEVDTVSPITLTIDESVADVLSFGGTSSGAIVISFVNGTASFTQGTAVAATTYTATELQALRLVFDEAEDTAVTVDLTGSGVTGEYLLQTEFLDEITLTGTLANIDVVRITVIDPTEDLQDTPSLKIDTSGVIGSSAQLIFDLPASAENDTQNPLDNDTIILTTDSRISAAFSTVSVDDGHVIALSESGGDAILQGGQTITVASTITVRASDLATESDERESRC